MNMVTGGEREYPYVLAMAERAANAIENRRQKHLDIPLRVVIIPLYDILSCMSTLVRRKILQMIGTVLFREDHKQLVLEEPGYFTQLYGYQE
jgi:hypothetical protein